jgi:Berberine and berberine like
VLSLATRVLGKSISVWHHSLTGKRSISDDVEGNTGGRGRLRESTLNPDALKHLSTAAETDERCIAWARAFFQASAPYASDGAYVNFMTEEESDRVAAAYGANYDRLAQIKKQYDPDTLFHLNQNIKPSPRQGRETRISVHPLQKRRFVHCRPKAVLELFSPGTRAENQN